MLLDQELANTLSLFTFPCEVVGLALATIEAQDIAIAGIQERTQARVMHNLAKDEKLKGLTSTDRELVTQAVKAAFKE